MGNNQSCCNQDQGTEGNVNCGNCCEQQQPPDWQQQQQQQQYLQMQSQQLVLAQQPFSNSQLAQSQFQLLQQSYQGNLQNNTMLQQSGQKPDNQLFYSQIRQTPNQIQTLLSPPSQLPNQSDRSASQQFTPVQIFQQAMMQTILQSQAAQQSQQVSPQNQMTQSQQLLAFLAVSQQQQQQNQFQPGQQEQLEAQQQQQNIEFLVEQQKQYQEMIKQQELEAQKQLELQQEQKMFKDQQTQLYEQWKEKQEEDLLKIPPHQSLDEEVLPELSNHFNPMKNGGLQQFNDPYHGQIYVLQNKHNPGFKLALKVVTYSSYKEYERQEKLFQLHQLEFTHPHLVNLHLIHSKKFLCMCSATFRVCLLLDNIEGDLEVHKKHFYENEQWIVLDSLIDALYALQLKGIVHGNVRLGNFLYSQTIDDHLLYKLNYQKEEKPQYQEQVKSKSLRLSNGQIFYASPQQYKGLLNGEQNPELQNQWKADVFALGMCMIHLGLGPAKSAQLMEVYESETQSVSEARLRHILHSLREHCSKQYIQVIESMVIVDEKLRPDWIQLSETMSLLHSKRVFQQTRIVNYIYNLEVQKRYHVKQSNKSALIASKVQTPRNQSYVTSYFSEIQHNEHSHPLKEKNSYKDEEFMIDQFLLSGQKVENRHRGTLNYPDGSRYEGEIKNGMRDGLGQLHMSDGSVFDCCWKEDRQQGKGIYYDSHGNTVYEGAFQKGKYEGFGVLRNSFPRYRSDAFEYRDFNKLGQQWLVYEGDFRDHMRNGFGTLTLSNKEKLVCHFRDDLPDGVGVFHSVDLKRVNGQWDSGILARQV